MATKKSRIVKASSSHHQKSKPRSLAYFERGIYEDVSFANMSLALCGDLLSGRITPNIGNAVCASARNVLKIVELKYKYGRPHAAGAGKTLMIGTPKEASS